MSSRSIYGVPSSLFSLLGFLFYWSEASSSAGLEFDSKKGLRPSPLPFLFIPFLLSTIENSVYFTAIPKKKYPTLRDGHIWWPILSIGTMFRHTWKQPMSLKLLLGSFLTLEDSRHTSCFSWKRRALRLVLSIPKLCFPVPPRLSPLMKKNEPGLLHTEEKVTRSSQPISSIRAK